MLTAALVVSDVISLWQIVALSIVSSAVLAIGMPATQTLVISLVPRSSFQAANSLNALIFSLGRALGPLAGGLLIPGFGLGAPFLALIGLYILSIAFTLRLPVPEKGEENGEPAGTRP